MIRCQHHLESRARTVFSRGCCDITISPAGSHKPQSFPEFWRLEFPGRGAYFYGCVLLGDVLPAFRIIALGKNKMILWDLWKEQPSVHEDSTGSHLLTRGPVCQCQRIWIYGFEEGSQALCSPQELRSDEGRSDGHIVGTATVWSLHQIVSLKPQNSAFCILTIVPIFSEETPEPILLSDSLGVADEWSLGPFSEK